MKVTVVVGARPNFMKAAPVLAGLASCPELEPCLVHTGQHYDADMSGSFLADLGLPAPEAALGVGSGSHGAQTAEVLQRFERYLEEAEPALVVVVGDVNSTVAAALAAVKRHIPVAHVEAGLRSGDRTMPEEINRCLTDVMSALCFVTEPAGVRNLQREGVPDQRIQLVGNTMIDTLLRFRDEALAQPLPAGLPDRFGVVTLHRPANVDQRRVLAGILDVLGELGRSLPLVWPVHPRTQARLDEFRLPAARQGLHLLPPTSYKGFLALMARAHLILTDSGGIQEEALVLQVPTVTLRDNTERPITLECGGNVLAGSDPDRIREAVALMLSRDRSAIRTPPLWDGKAGQRIAQGIQRFLAKGGGL